MTVLHHDTEKWSYSEVHCPTQLLICTIANSAGLIMFEYQYWHVSTLSWNGWSDEAILPAPCQPVPESLDVVLTGALGCITVFSVSNVLMRHWKHANLCVCSFFSWEKPLVLSFAVNKEILSSTDITDATSIKTKTCPRTGPWLIWPNLIRKARA